MSKMLAIKTLGLNISLTPEEVTDLTYRIELALRNITGVDEILNESRKDYLMAIQLKEEALAAKYVYMLC